MTRLKTLMRAPDPGPERTTATSAALGGSRARLAIAGWLSGIWALDPFFVLLTTFVYAPYFATGIVSDPARGQALWGFAASGAGLAVATLSPVLGAVADAGGHRKPWIAAFGAMLVAGASMLWFGRPNDQASIVPVLAAYGFGVVGAECVLVFLNSMMPMLVPPERLGRLSGTGAATAYVGGLASLFLTLGWLAPSSETGRTLLGFSPFFGLDPGQRQGDRVAGPLAAIWFLAFSVPLFLLTPDPARKTPLRSAIRSGLATLAGTLAGLRRHRNLAAFLIANMAYSDGLVALFAFGGIYAAGTFGWRTIEVGGFGMLLLVAGTFGAFFGGRLDDRFGPRSVIVASLGILISAGIAILSVGRDHVLFVITVAPPHSDQGLYASTPERMFVAIGLLIGAVAGPLQAASRSLLARLAPPDRVTQHFGLLALSGKVTSFVGPFLVGLVTAATASQRPGMAVLLAFFLTGLAAILRVRLPAGETARSDDGPRIGVDARGDREPTS